MQSHPSHVAGSYVAQAFRPAPVYVALLAVAALVGCAGTAASPESSAAESSGPPPQTLKLTYDAPTVGAEVRATATGLPAGQTVDLTWETVTGGWVVEDYYHFRGKKYSKATSSLGKFTVDAQGRLEARFHIPEDYGGVHDVIALIDGKPVAQNGIEVTQSFEMNPTSGPVGTPVELRVKGLGWRTMESTWVVNWDNNLLGFVSAAGTKGSAVARFRAVGPVGPHSVRLLTGWQGQGYLNYEQSPVAHLPRPQFTFHTTPGRASSGAAFAEPYQRQPVPKTELHVTNAMLTLSPTQGPVGTRAALKGEGFPRGATLQLVWQTYVGSRVSGNGFEPQENALGTVQVNTDGRIDVTRIDSRRSRRSSRVGSARQGQDPCARVLRHRDEHCQHVADIRARWHPGDDSSEGRRVDGVRQHLHRNLRQRVHGLRMRVQQSRRRGHQFHRDR